MTKYKDKSTGIEYSTFSSAEHIPEGPRFIDNESTRKEIKFTPEDEENYLKEEVIQSEVDCFIQRFQNGDFTVPQEPTSGTEITEEQYNSEFAQRDRGAVKAFTRTKLFRDITKL